MMMISGLRYFRWANSSFAPVVAVRGSGRRLTPMHWQGPRNRHGHEEALGMGSDAMAPVLAIIPPRLANGLPIRAAICGAVQPQGRWPGAKESEHLTRAPEVEP